jgi:alkanesulfonate monooxygenase SsuD/methylene tetrahydromethanopterin reductase-like flavin-dependent oxidoreductase (luciferase family)
MTPSPPLRLSVLDLSPVAAGSSGTEALRNTLDLALLTDALGYHRYWLAEHHNSAFTACPAPEVMIAHVACATRHLRVGSGGVMLPNHAPLRVAEAFKVLHALHPGRIDLGIGRAPGTDGMTALALRRSREALGYDGFPEQMEELLGFFSGQFPEGHRFRRVRAIPRTCPRRRSICWAPATSARASRAKRGWASPSPTTSTPGPSWNRSGCTAIPSGRRGRVNTGTPRRRSWRCQRSARKRTSGRTSWRDRWNWASCGCTRAGWDRCRASKRPPRIPTRTRSRSRCVPSGGSAFLVGAPMTLRERLTAFAREAGVGEVLINTMVHDHGARRRSYELLAEALALPPPAGNGGTPLSHRPEGPEPEAR